MTEIPLPSTSVAPPRGGERFPETLASGARAALDNFELIAAPSFETLTGLAESPEALIEAARAHAGGARFDEARALLDRAVEIFGARPEIQARRVALARKSGDLDLRRRLADTFGEEARRRCFPLWRETVRLAIDTGCYEDAERALRSPPAADDRERAQAELLRGQLEAARGNHARALADFGHSLALDPLAHFQIHVELARTALLTLEIDIAREHFTRVMAVQALAGEGVRFSQSRIAAEIGQLLDELLDEEALARQLRALACDPSEQQIAELRRRVAAPSEITAPAIHLLMALRRQGRLRERLESAGAPRLGAIPKRITQYWDDSRPPPDVAAAMRTWMDLNPDYEYRRFDHAGAIAYLGAHAPGALAAYLGAGHAAQRADIFRLAYLASEGGFYADADDRCLVPLSSWMPRAASFVGYIELCGAVANNCLAAAPGHVAVSLALASAISAIERGEAALIWQSTGPGLMTRAFARAVAKDPELFEESLLLDLGALNRAVAIHCQMAYKKTERHWARAAR